MAGLVPAGGPGANPLMGGGAPPAMPPSGPINPINALAGAMPRRPVPPVPPMPVAPAAAPVLAPGVADPISDRVPVPKHHFPEEHHKHLHEKTMGEAFDDPHAQDFVRRIYNTVHAGYPDVPPKHILEATRDAFHAAKHRFMPYGMAGGSVGPMAQARHAAEQRETLAADRGDAKQD